MIELKRINVHRLVNSKEKAERLISEGFAIIKDELNLMESNEDKKEVIDYNIMTVEQLKVICKENNLEGYTNLAKDTLIAFMKENIKE